MNFLEQLIAAGFESRMSWFRYLNQRAKPGGIVFVGDSLTQEFLIHEMLMNHPRIAVIHNRGIGGDTTTGLLSRLQESVFDLSPSKVFLLIGINDLSQADTKPEDVASRIQTIAEQILQHCPDTTLYLESLYPVNESQHPMIDKATVFPKSNARIDQINCRLKTLQNEKLHYLDINSLLRDEDGNLRLEYTREGLHLTPEGYRVVLDELLKYIQ